MFAPPITALKPLLGLAVVGGTVATGSSLSIYSSSTKKQKEAISMKETGGDEAFEVIQPIISPEVSYNYAIFQELNSAVSAEGKTFTCQLDGGSRKEDCLLWKIQDKEGQSIKRLKLNEFKELSSGVTSDVKFEETKKGIYKVQSSNAFVVDWQSNTTKKLKIYAKNASGAEESTTEPLLTLDVKGALKTTNVFRGLLKYMLVQAKTFTGGDSTNSFTTTGKTFECAYPSSPENKKNCEILHFYEQHSDGTNLDTVPIRSTLNATDSITKEKHYLIKLAEPININSSSLDQKGTTMNVKVFTDAGRQTAASTGITSIGFQYISPVIVINSENQFDFAITM